MHKLNTCELCIDRCSAVPTCRGHSLLTQPGIFDWCLALKPIKHTVKLVASRNESSKALALTKPSVNQQCLFSSLAVPLQDTVLIVVTAR